MFIVLPETWCYNPMTDILDEQFLTPLNNATHPWSATGPVYILWSPNLSTL